MMAAGANSATAAGSSGVPWGTQIVIISIDGLRSDVLSDVTTPTIMMLARRGSQSFKDETVSPSITTPSHASMLSGYTPAKHKITWDDWAPEKGMIQVPTLLSVAQDNGLLT